MSRRNEYEELYGELALYSPEAEQAKSGYDFILRSSFPSSPYASLSGSLQALSFCPSLLRVLSSWLYQYDFKRFTAPGSSPRSMMLKIVSVN